MGYEGIEKEKRQPIGSGAADYPRREPVIEQGLDRVAHSRAIDFVGEQRREHLRHRIARQIAMHRKPRASLRERGHGDYDQHDQRKPGIVVERGFQRGQLRREVNRLALEVQVADLLLQGAHAALEVA